MDKTFRDTEKEEGIEGVVNLWLYGDYQKREDVLEYVMLRTGFSEAELRKADNGRRSFFSYGCNKNSFLATITLQAARLLHYLGSDFRANLDMTPQLQECAVAGYEMTDKRRLEFSIHQLETQGLCALSWAKQYGSDPLEVKDGIFKTFNFFLDTPAAIGLFHNDEPRAVVSFFPEDEKTLQIKQIQGARILTRMGGRYAFGEQSSGGGCLGTLDWKRFLVSSVEKIAKDLDYSTVTIQGARNNKWVLNGDLLLERGLQIYDATAERFGYSQVGIGNWYKVL